MSLPPYLTLRSEVLPVIRRDFYVNDTSILNPNDSNPLYDGEWLELNSSYKVLRGTGEQATPAWQVFAERGRFDTQSIGRVPLLFLGGYEAECKIVDVTGCSVGNALVIDDVIIDGDTKRGLVKLGAGAGEHMIFGYVTRVYSDRLAYWCPNVPAWKHVT